MNRRDLLMRALTGAAAVAALPGIATAAEAGGWTNVVFTEDNLGHWKGREATHLPVVQVEGGKVTVRTPHGMSEAHYIVSHSVVLADGSFVDRKTFTWKDEPVSECTLPAGYKGKISVTSTCNLHDMWVKTVTV
jgi:superoxide reductase